MKRILLLGVSLGIAASSFAQLQCTGGLSWGTQIGQTGYDLHSNSAVANRIVRNADGSLSVVWIDHYDELASDNTPKSIRGLGYNHFDAATSSWTGGSGAGSGECWEEKNGCASDYIGWPEIINTTAGKEIVMSHYKGNGTPGSSTTTRDVIAAKGTWNDTELTGIDEVYDVNAGAADNGGTWPRAVNVGETIHMVLAWSGGGDPYVAVRDSNGVNDPIRYYRSKDAGATWDITNFDFNSRGVTLDSTELARVGGDSYAIHAKGDVVAVTFGGGYESDWLMFKSTDNGDSWTKTSIANNHGLGDTIFLGENGSKGLLANNDDFELIIDDNGTVHVFASMQMIDDNGFFYGTTNSYDELEMGMLYWKEGMMGPDTVAYPDYNSDPLGIADSLDLKQQPYYGNYVLGWPSASVDANGNLFLVYSAVNENSVAYINPEQQADTSGFHDLYMVYSLDNGTTWCNGDDYRVNIAQDVYGEFGGTPTQDDLFPNTVANIAADGIIHLTWQGDWDSPGLALRSTNYPHASDNCNYITYAKLDVSNMAACGDKVEVGVAESIKNNINFNVVPNPASNVAVVTSEKAIKTVSLMNMFGQTVKSESVNGSTTYTVNVSDLAEGMYIISIQTEAGFATQKLNITK